MCYASQAMQELPPGQGPAIAAFVAAAVPRLAVVADSHPTTLPLSPVLSGCLVGLRTDLTTAPALAVALQRLISDSLSGPLRTMLLQVTDTSAVPMLSSSLVLRVHYNAESCA